MVATVPAIYDNNRLVIVFSAIQRFINRIFNQICFTTTYFISFNFIIYSIYLAHSLQANFYKVCHGFRLAIIFKSLLTTFEMSIIFRDSWGSSENWLKYKTLLKPYHTLSKFNQVKLVKICETLWGHILSHAECWVRARS